ncbi:hypothetical protein CAP47_08125 [Psychroflexus sp. S27]|uniref:ComEC/Rec2 family competence protein n=1 Tax=Psychroflexus sp. S27 TaxID=1982757 RepID=UPI000C29E7F5|nr:ComEC/Rec2 family competence protein [Psychroflexus sp. S27]PJX21597.1 hypothetical protein CAP47_08125 [Psychroflexus sp. S27]
MKFLNINLIILTLFLCVGVALGFHIEIQNKALIFISTSSVFIVSYFTIKRNLKLSFIFFGLACLMLFFIGYARAQLESPQLQKNHYAQGDISHQTPVQFQGEITEVLKANAYNDKYYLELFQINSQDNCGKILLKVKKDSINKPLKIGHQIHGIATIKKLNPPQNPQRFNYKAYMKFQSVYATLDTQNEYIEIYKLNSSLKSHADEVRFIIKNKLENAGFKGESLNLIEAMLLGRRDNISKETLSHFQDSGVIHVLAISGLHVGIILIFLHWLTYFTLYNRLTRLARPLIIIIGLWAFAFIAGLSPSVVRATLMFSILSFNYFLQRRTSTVNILCVALLLMLIYQPQYLFQVGFQLSFTAVLGILTLHPRLKKIYQPRYFLDRIIWDVLSVSIIAQISVLPLLLYYFNQASALFWLANIMVIPFLGIILGFGIFSIVLSLLGLMIKPLVVAYSFILETLLKAIEWVAIQDQFIFANIYFNKAMLWTSLLILISLLIWDNKSKIRSYTFLNISFSAFLIVFLNAYKTYKSQSDLFILKSYNKSLIIEINGSEMIVYKDSIAESQEKDYATKSLAQLKGIQTIQERPLKNVYTLNGNKSLLVIDSLGAYEKNHFNDYVLLRSSPKINLERFISSTKPKLIIADASNYRSYVNRWKSTCEKYNIDFHSIYESGALELSKLKKLP